MSGIRAALLLGVALAFQACAPGASVLPRAEDVTIDPRRPAVVFVPGYYGSALKDPRTNTRLFLRPAQTLWGSLPIALHASELGLRPSPDLAVEGIFGSVAVLPYFYGMKVYTPLLQSLGAGGAQVIPFAYDWRGDLPAAAAALAGEVEKLRRAGVPRISLVAHSMGGLVVTYFLGYGDQPLETARLDWRGAKGVSRVVYCGTPFRGAMSILRNLQHGTGYPWNHDLLEAGTVASFPASYMVSPLARGELVGAPGVKLGDPATWRAWHLGYFHEAASPARAAYSDQQVVRASRFLRLLELTGAPAPAGLRVLNVVGTEKPTLARGYALAADQRVAFRAEELPPGVSLSALEEDGDGTVPLNSAAAPAALGAATLELRSAFAHDQLFLDPKIEKEYARFIGAP